MNLLDMNTRNLRKGAVFYSSFTPLNAASSVSMRVLLQLEAILEDSVDGVKIVNADQSHLEWLVQMHNGGEIW